jgi:hypothetical protein
MCQRRRVTAHRCARSGSSTWRCANPRRQLCKISLA